MDSWQRAEEKLLELVETQSEKLDGGILLVDRFLNQGINIPLYKYIGEAFADAFRDQGIDKVMTIEASGIPIAYATADALGCNALFAKKHKPLNQSSDRLECEVFSYTKKYSYNLSISRYLLEAGERVLLVDDVLARGAAMTAMSTLVREGGAEIVAALAIINKPHQGGQAKLERAQIPVRCLLDFDENLNLIRKKRH
ncbi:MAG: phosphoribosyltransferase family protein [Eubacteriales bacterium]|nr:phosphoribosyltransferase family protein [Eubacteriales bacterium]